MVLLPIPGEKSHCVKQREGQQRDSRFLVRSRLLIRASMTRSPC